MGGREQWAFMRDYNLRSPSPDRGCQSGLGLSIKGNITKMGENDKLLEIMTVEYSAEEETATNIHVAD